MIEEIRKQAESGNQEAQYQLGQLYYNGEKLRKNYRTAFEWFSKAAESGHVVAQRVVAEMYISGKKIGKDHKKAFYWMLCAAMQGDIIAYEQLADMHVNGKGNMQDREKAVEWFRKTTIPEKTEVQYKLGEIFYSTDLDYSKECYKMAASANYPWALYKLGLLFLEKEKDINEAEYWFQKLYSLDSVDPMIIAWVYLRQSVIEKAEEWFEKAVVENETNIGKIVTYYSWFDEYEKQFEWCLRAVEKGYDYFTLGQLYERGQGTEIDYEKALYWYEKALSDGSFMKDRIRSVKRKINKAKEKILDKDDALLMIAKLLFLKRIPVWIHVNGSVDSIKQKLRHYILIINEDKCQDCLFGSENNDFADEIIKELCIISKVIDANDIDDNEKENYTSSSGEFVKEKGIKFVFFASPFVDKREKTIEWSEEVGVKAYFTDFQL